MTAPWNNPKVTAALKRAGMPSPSADVIERLTFACNLVDGPAPDEILEISQANWANEDQGTDVLVIQTRDVLLLVGKGKRGRFKPMETFAIRAPYVYYQDVDEEDEMAGASVFFVGKEGHKHFLLSFANAHERHRMFRCVFEAHAGYFSRWGLQLDPANYAADFERYYSEFVASGVTEAHGLRERVEQQYGEFDHSNALGLATEWRCCELEDAAAREPSRRVMRMSYPMPWDDYPEARRVFLRLGEQLYDEGLLGPPYDEYSFDTDEPLRPLDAGPARLLALLTLAGYAKALRDPRADEWIMAARSGIPCVPAAVFPPKLRELWSEIGDLPAVDNGPPPEIPIWDDVDVRTIATTDAVGAHRRYSVETLTVSDNALITSFLESVAALEQAEQPGHEAVADVCLKGVLTFESLSPLAPAGWRKLVVYIVSDQACDLWDKHQAGVIAGRLAQWVIVTIERNGWGPDGRSTALGQHHSHAMDVATNSGIGIVEFDEITGSYRAPTGDEARRAAVAGQF